MTNFLKDAGTFFAIYAFNTIVLGALAWGFSFFFPGMIDPVMVFVSAAFWAMKDTAEYANDRKADR